MSIREVLTFTKGSKKQCSWAYDILDEAFAAKSWRATHTHRSMRSAVF